ncbi:hypothetical protein HUJ04_011915 [Dendroctonus ponderosae]|nr:hypothetical protein HUJ04_011915 [Dendroctonus ponderosae]KAH1022526.1 hypothetical protein HUJ04_011915 [Dendroctonus ponderosae]
MEEKVRDSVMERVGFFALVGLAIVGCCTTMVLAERRQVVGSRCIYDSHCIEGAYCTGREGWEVCKCREEDNFIPSEDLMSCVGKQRRF